MDFASLRQAFSNVLLRSLSPELVFDFNGRALEKSRDSSLILREMTPWNDLQPKEFSEPNDG